MKITKNLENEINYKKLKAGVSQQILRKLDKNFMSFFKSIKDWKKNKNKYKGMPKPLYNKMMAKYKSRLDKQGEQKWSKRLQKLTDNRNNKIKDYLHKASNKIVKECVNNKISTVVIGDVAKSNNKINLGKRTNQNFVNISLGQFIEKLKYKLELHNIKVKVNDESYTSKASFIDNDELPKKHTPNKRYTFSGKRVKRGLYKPLNKVFQKVNADCNGAYNIIRKVVPKFSFEDLSKKVDDGIAGWFLPHIKIIDSSIKVNVK